MVPGRLRPRSVWRLLNSFLFVQGLDHCVLATLVSCEQREQSYLRVDEAGGPSRSIQAPCSAFIIWVYFESRDSNILPFLVSPMLSCVVTRGLFRCECACLVLVCPSCWGGARPDSRPLRLRLKPLPPMPPDSQQPPHPSPPPCLPPTHTGNQQP